MKLFVGIDHGFKGGIAALDPAGKIVNLWPMPVKKSKSGRDSYDIDMIATLFCLFESEDAVVTVEKLQPMPGSLGGGVANFQRGAWIMWPAMARAHNLTCLEYRPIDWQRQVLAPGKGDTKVRAHAAAKKLWPEQSFVLPRCRKTHDGLIDAALIGYVGRRASA